MDLRLDIQSKRLEGYRPPPLERTPCGIPILPSKGDIVVINNVPLIVTDIIWTLHHEVDNNRVTVYVEDIPPL
jgi:hypothetical protein